jgi:hypothetical protein
MVAFKYKDFYIVTPLTSIIKSEIQLLSESLDCEISEVPVDTISNEDKVLTLYQFYAYIDAINNDNNLNAVVDMVVDRSQTEIDNLNLGGIVNPLGRSQSIIGFHSKDTVENFDSFNVVQQLESLFSDHE